MATLEPQDLRISYDAKVDGLTGAAVIAVPLQLSPGRDGLDPKLSLSYSSSGANSPFGLGWSLDGIAGISIDTRRRFPSYDGNDAFRMTGVGELVPAVRPDTTQWVDDRGGFQVRRYVGRNHSAHLLIEEWTDKANAAVHWRTRDARNVLTIYGSRADGGSRLADPDRPSRIFAWLPDVQIDSLGNAIEFDYAPETPDGVDTSTTFERARLSKGRNSSAQRYIKRMRYGNTVPLAAGDPPLPDAAWCFEVVFDYGDHAGPVTPLPQPSAAWPVRPDAYSSFRPGFDLRTYRLCRRLLMFHRFAALGEDPFLVSEYEFEYRLDAAGTTLQAIHYARSRRDAVMLRQALPPLQFTYSAPTLARAFESAELDASRNTPGGLAGSYRWIDLWGEGIPGILYEHNRAWYYKRNEGGGHFAAQEIVVSQPSYRLFDAVIRDFDADGNVDLVVQHGRLAGYYSHNRERGEWDAFRPFASLPHLEAAAAHAQWADLDGDGRSDLLLADPDRPVWYRSLGRRGFAEARDVELPSQARLAAPGMENTRLGLFFADMAGDGGAHQLRIRDGRVEYWPHLGHGRFADSIAMEGAPDFAESGEFDANRLLITDLNGDGIADLLYIGLGEIRYWINAGGNRLIEGPPLRNTPFIDQISTARVIDFFGDGTLCLVWSSMLSNAAQPISILRLTDGVRPNLLLTIDDGLGSITRMTYASSASHYLRDRRAGTSWSTRLPLHVNVVDQLEVIDGITGARAVTRYAYHDGHYDGGEQVFRGFGRVEIDDADLHPAPGDPDSAHTMPRRRCVWHHLGTPGSDQLAVTYGLDPLLNRIDAHGIESSSPVDSEVYEDGYRILAGQILREEIYALDVDGNRAVHPFEVVQHGYWSRLVNPAADGRRAAFDVYLAESVRHTYEQALDPRVNQSAALDVDEWGQVRLSVKLDHARRAGVAPDAAAQTQPIVTVSQQTFLNVLQDDRHELGLRIETKEFDIGGLAANGVDLIGRNTLAGVIANAIPTAKPFGEAFAGGGVEARVASWERSYFWNTAFDDALPLGQVGFPALTHHSERSAFTPAFVGAKLPAADPALVQADGLYSLRDGYWWVIEPVNHYGSAAQFRRLLQTERIDGAITIFAYDASLMFLTETRDAAGNVSTIESDYHILVPRRMTDPNGAVAEFLYDALGVAIATTRTSEVLDDAGVARPYGFEPLSSFVPHSPAKLSDVLQAPGFYLQQASSAVYYDLAAWRRDGAPTTVLVLAAERLLHEGSAQPPPPVIGIEISYFDGLSRTLQGKKLVEAGLAIARGPDGTVVLGADGRPSLAPADQRWLVSGHVVYDRKQQPVRAYEPFFSPLFTYEPEPELARFGTSSEFRYDTLGRKLREDFANGTFATIEYSAWTTREFDANDTVDQSAYKAIHSALPPGNPERQALDKALAHAGTPHITHFNPAGLPAKAVGTSAPGQDRVTEFHRDSDGKVIGIVDARGILTVSNDLDMLGRPLRSASADAGESRQLPDAFDKAVHVWDARGFHIWRQFDRLDRPTAVRVRQGASAWRLCESYSYGEDPAAANATARHARGRVVAQRDDSGLTEVIRYDPAGLVLEQQRQIRQNYMLDADWADPASVVLEPEVYRTVASYDAYGRPLRHQTPDGAVTDYGHLLGGGFGRIAVTTADGLVTNLNVLAAAEYNARGQRQFLKLGNGVEINHTFDPDTYRTSRIAATRQTAAGASVLQDIAYTYDPVGNVVSHVDAAQEPPGTAVITGLGVSSRCDHTYDALYQLIRSEGRAHQALLEHDDRPDGMAPGAFRGSRRAALNDGGAIKRYQQIYLYDPTGNLTQIRHVGPSSWTKDVWISANSNRGLPARDIDGNPIGLPETCFDAAGNCTFLPHLRRIEWNHRNLISRAVVVDRSAVGQPDDAEYYVYDAQGQRTRKVMERLVGGQVEITEKLYLDGCEIKRIRRGATLLLRRLTSLVADEIGRLALVHRWTADVSARETDDISVARIHYPLANHLGSSLLELAAEGAVISYEEYFPFGGTAFIAGDDAREVSLKEYRHSGKERDEASGFYYFGFRYYWSSIGRWLSPDPIGPEGGLNLYAYCFNNPVTLADPDGLDPQPGSRGKPVHYDTFDSFVARLPPGQQQTIDPGRRYVGVQDVSGKGPLSATSSEIEDFRRAHPNAQVFIYDPTYNRLRGSGLSASDAADVADAFSFATSAETSTATKSLESGAGAGPLPPGDKPISDHPTDDPNAEAAGTGNKGDDGTGQAAGGTGNDAGSPKTEPGTGAGGTGGPGTGTGSGGAATGGGGSDGDPGGKSIQGSGPGSGQRGIGTGNRDVTVPAPRAGVGAGSGQKAGSGGGHGQSHHGTPGKLPGASGASPLGTPGGLPGGQPGGIAGGDPGGTIGGAPGGTPDGAPPTDPDARRGTPTNDNDAGGTRTGSLSGDRNGTGAGNGTPGGGRGSSAGASGGPGAGQSHGGSGGGGKAQTPEAETTLDKVTKVAGYWNLEFSDAEEGGVTSGGIPGGFGPFKAGTKGQALYIALTILDIIVTIITLGEAVAAKGGIRAVMRGAMASVKGALRTVGKLFTKEFWSTAGRRSIRFITKGLGEVFGTVASGARNQLKWLARRGRKEAGAAYNAILKDTEDVAKIAKSTGYDPKRIAKIKQYLFGTKEFEPGMDIVKAWRRMQEGAHAVTDADRILLKHETAEMFHLERLQKKGLNWEKAQQVAHKLAESSFNYAKEIGQPSASKMSKAGWWNLYRD